MNLSIHSAQTKRRSYSTQSWIQTSGRGQIQPTIKQTNKHRQIGKHGSNNGGENTFPIRIIC